MKLIAPFFISARLAPAIKIADAVLSFDHGQFVIDFADGSEHKVTGFNFPRGRIHGDTNESVLQDGFASVCAFLSACAESRQYATRKGKSAMDGENSDLFPESVGEWAEQNSDEIDMVRLGIEETKDLISA